MLLVSIKEFIKVPHCSGDNSTASQSEAVSDSDSSATPGWKRKRKRRKRTDCESSPKTARNDNTEDGQLPTPNASLQHDLGLHSAQSGLMTDNVNSTFTLQEMKHDSDDDDDDDDLIEIIKEEPGIYSQRDIVSIQQIQQSPSASTIHPKMMPGMAPAIPPGFIPGSTSPGGPMFPPIPSQLDLNEVIYLEMIISPRLISTVCQSFRP